MEPAFAPPAVLPPAVLDPAFVLAALAVRPARVVGPAPGAVVVLLEVQVQGINT